MKTTEALKLALDALENTDRSKLFDLERNAIATIKEILAQPNSEYERGFDDGFILRKEKDGKREWVGLTDEEIKDCLGPEAVRIPQGWSELTRAIETKLKHKNT